MSAIAKSQGKEKVMQVLASTISDKLAKVYPDFEDTFGFGPCGAFAALKREEGWGDVAVCIASVGDTEFSHYVIVQDGAIIDMANPLGESLTYTEVEILDTNEMPELCDDYEAVSWLKANL